MASTSSSSHSGHSCSSVRQSRASTSSSSSSCISTGANSCLVAEQEVEEFLERERQRRLSGRLQEHRRSSLIATAAEAVLPPSVRQRFVSIVSLVGNGGGGGGGGGINQGSTNVKSTLVAQDSLVPTVEPSPMTLLDVIDEVKKMALWHLL